MLQDVLKNVKTRFGEGRDMIVDAAKRTARRINTPDNLLWKCPRCRAVIETETFDKNLRVCPSCDYHSRLTAFQRIELIADEGSFDEIDGDLISENPIDFNGYPEKIAAIRAETGLNEAVVTGSAKIFGVNTAFGVMDSHFLMGSMGSVVGEKIARLFEFASSRKLPVIIFAASGGARMQEGVFSLMQMAKTSAAVGKFSENGGLFISVLTDPTTGGVTASFASLGDIIIAEPKSVIGFAGRKVIQDTIRQQLPDNFQTAEFALEKGFADLLCPRSNLKNVLFNLLKAHNYAAN